MSRARILNVFVLLSLILALSISSPAAGQDAGPHQPQKAEPVMRTVTVDEQPPVSALGGSWFGSNLILNGDAEADPPGRPTTGWTGGASDFIVINNYGEPGYPFPNDPGPINRGTHFFQASQNAAAINAWQAVYIDHLAASIDSGQVGFQMSGFFGGIGSSSDYAKLRVYFEDINGKSIASAVAIGGVSAADRMNRTGLLERSTQGKVPKGTRRLNFQLEMSRGTSGTYNPNALADNLSFILEPQKIFIPSLSNGSTRPLRSAPAAPTNLVATGDSLTTIHLTWADNAANETGYLVERALVGSNTFTILGRTVADIHEYEDKELAPQTGYTYRLSAFNEVGSSSAVTAKGTTLSNPTTKPAAPATCWTSNTGAESSVVGWTDSSTNEEYFILQFWTSYYQTWTTLANIQPNSTYVTVVDLQPNSSVSFRIAAHNVAGDSAWCTTPVIRTSSLANTFIVENAASYPIVYLEVDGVNQFPVYPMGLMPGGSYTMSLPAGHHTVWIMTGFWQSKTSRFDMYSYYDEFDLSNGYTATLTVPDVSLEGILTQFDTSGQGYWEGYYYDANLNCRTAAFRFYDNGRYDFYVSNVKNGSGAYSEGTRSPSTFSLTFNVPGYQGLLLEQYGEFYMKNGPASWKQITYNYKPQGYMYNPFCP